MINAAGVITWNGTPVDLAQLAVYLEQTKALPVEPELQVQPDPYARYFIVDNVMAVIKRSGVGKLGFVGNRSEENTSELPSLMRISYAVFCLKTKTTIPNYYHLYNYLFTKIPSY